VTIQAGQCGNQVGTKFWETVCEEHNIGNDGKFNGNKDSPQYHGVDVLFRKLENEKYVPRSILFDLEPGTIDRIRSSSMIRNIFQPDNFVVGVSPAGNWAKGFYTEGYEMMDEVMDAIRLETEKADHLQGFQLIHSLGGGTGSGMGSHLLIKLREEYPDRMLYTHSIVPSSDVVTEPYHIVLGMHYLIENSDATYTYDNGALSNYCSKKINIIQPIHDDLNHIIAYSMSGATCSLRYPIGNNHLNCDLRRLVYNLVPFPRLHFLMTSISPFTASSSPLPLPLQDNDEKPMLLESTVEDENEIANVTQQIFDSNNLLCNTNLKTGKYLSCVINYRRGGAGDSQLVLSSKEVDLEISKIKDMNSSSFIEWIPDNCKTMLCPIPLTSLPSPPFSSHASSHVTTSSSRSAAESDNITVNKPSSLPTTFATMTSNNTSIQHLWHRVSLKFYALWRRKAYLHHYTGEGMDELEFEESIDNLNDLIGEYQRYQDLGVDDEYEED